MSFLRELLRKYGRDFYSLQDVIDAAAEKHLRYWVKLGCKESIESYAARIADTNLLIRKEDQIFLAEGYYRTQGSLSLVDDIVTFGLGPSIERVSRKQVDELVRWLFTRLAYLGLSLKEQIKESGSYDTVEICHQNPFRGLADPIALREAMDMSVYEYIFDDEFCVDVYISDYPYLAFVAKKKLLSGY